MLVGQAPGWREIATGLPFAHDAGRRLVGWLGLAGVTIDDFRRRWYVTSVGKCYPGRRPGASVDSPPSRSEIQRWSPVLHEEVRLVEPQLLVLVGGLAHRFAFGASARLDDLVGRRLTLGSQPRRRGDLPAASLRGVDLVERPRAHGAVAAWDGLLSTSWAGLAGGAYERDTRGPGARGADARKRRKAASARSPVAATRCPSRPRTRDSRASAGSGPGSWSVPACSSSGSWSSVALAASVPDLQQVSVEDVLTSTQLPAERFGSNEIRIAGWFAQITAGCSGDRGGADATASWLQATCPVRVLLPSRPAESTNQAVLLRDGLRLAAPDGKPFPPQAPAGAGPPASNSSSSSAISLIPLRHRASRPGSPRAAIRSSSPSTRGRSDDRSNRTDVHIGLVG